MAEVGLGLIVVVKLSAAKMVDHVVDCNHIVLLYYNLLIINSLFQDKMSST